MKVLFTHIPRTGGMSARAALEGHWVGSDELGANYDKNRSAISIALAGNDLVTTHAPFHQYPDVGNATILRDPVIRVWSHYHMFLRNPTLAHHMYAKAGFEAFMERSFWARDVMTKQLAGIGVTETAIDDDLDKAKKTLDMMDLVGYTNYLVDFIVKLGGLLGRKVHHIPHLNNLGVKRMRPDDGQTALIIEKNQYDMAIWNEVIP